MEPLSLTTIRAAARRIAPHVRRTPTVQSPVIDGLVGARVYAKAESLQASGSFKVRGAFNRLQLLDWSQREQGVIAYSSGNHGAAVALAGAGLGIPVTVVAPVTAPKVKLDAIRGFGAELITCDPAREDRAAIAAELAARRGLTVIAPYDDYAVMAGQGTIGLELVEALGKVDVVVVPVSGGGLLAGVATAVKTLNPAARVVGVEPDGADDTRESLGRGERVALGSEPATIADGLRARTPGTLTFPINARLLSDVVTVSDAEIVDAMRTCAQQLDLVVEPSGAVALAATLNGRIASQIRDAADVVAVVLSGGNVDPDRFAATAAPGSATAPVSQHQINSIDQRPDGHTWR